MPTPQHTDPKEMKVISYPCPICYKRKQSSQIRLQRNKVYFCNRCGSKLNKNQVEDKLRRISELEIAKIYIDEINKRYKKSYRDPVEGENPPDAISYDNQANELKIEVTKYGPTFWKQISSQDFISGPVDVIGWLIEGLKIKAEKQYEPNFRKDLVILLEGFLITDDYFESNETFFTDLDMNKSALAKLGFKEIWYVSRTRKRAYRIF